MMIYLSELNSPTFDLSNVAQMLFENYYLIPFPPKSTETVTEQSAQHFEITDPRIPRVTHGAMHASRVAAFVKIVHLLRQDHNDPVISDLNEWAATFNLSMTQLIHLTQIAGLFHDVSRKDEGIDLWDHESAHECFTFLQNNIPSLPETVARIIANTIAYKDNQEGFQQEARALSLTNEAALATDYLRQLVHDSDCLDVMRVRKTFKMRFLDLCHVPSLCDKPETILSLVTEVRALIHHQKDQWFDCAIVASQDGLNASEPLSKQFDLDLKCSYEWAPNVYTRIIADMQPYSSLQRVIQPLEILGNPIKTLILPPPYLFHSSLLSEIQQALMSATLIEECIESSAPHLRDYFLIRFNAPIKTSIINGELSDGPDVIAMIYSGDSAFTQRCNASLAALGGQVELGFRWTGSYDDTKHLTLYGYSLKIIYPSHKLISRSAIFEVLALEFEKASLITNHTECPVHAQLQLSLAEVEHPTPTKSHQTGFFKTRTRPVIDPSKLNSAAVYINQHISPIGPLYRRDNEIGINPSYQNSEAISCPLRVNQKKIWLLRSDFILAVGNKNSNWTNFKDTSLAEAIEPMLHPHVNWEDRYGHPSLASPDVDYDGSAYYGGYLAQRHDHIELYTFSGRYYRNDLEEFNKEILEAYIAYHLQQAYGDQPIIFIDAVEFEPNILDNFELSIFISDHSMPEYCMRHVYNQEKIESIFNRAEREMVCKPK